jgi:hypothetical protein
MFIGGIGCDSKTRTTSRFVLHIFNRHIKTIEYNRILFQSSFSFFLSFFYIYLFLAASFIGVNASDIHFMDLEDSMLPSYPELQIRETLTILIRTLKPDVVFTWFLQPNLDAAPRLSQW